MVKAMRTVESAQSRVKSDCTRKERRKILGETVPLQLKNRLLQNVFHCSRKEEHSKTKVRSIGTSIQNSRQYGISTTLRYVIHLMYIYFCKGAIGTVRFHEDGICYQEQYIGGHVCRDFVGIVNGVSTGSKRKEDDSYVRWYIPKSLDIENMENMEMTGRCMEGSGISLKSLSY